MDCRTWDSASVASLSSLASSVALSITTVGVYVCPSQRAPSSSETVGYLDRKKRTADTNESVSREDSNKSGLRTELMKATNYWGSTSAYSVGHVARN